MGIRGDRISGFSVERGGLSAPPRPVPGLTPPEDIWAEKTVVYASAFRLLQARDGTMGAGYLVVLRP